MDLRNLQRQYRWRVVLGAVLLAVLIIPATLHSAAAIKTLRNLPAKWLPESLPLRQDFESFVERFHVTDVFMVSWPRCQLGSAEVDRVVGELVMLTPQLADANSEAANQSATEVDRERWRQFQNRFREICGDQTPIDWVRSGTQIRDDLMAPPLNLSARSAARRLAGSMIGPDGRQTCIMLAFGPATAIHHRELLPMLRSVIATSVGIEDDQVAMVGGPVDGAAVDGEAVRSIDRYSIPSSLVAAILCFVCLRSLPLTLGILSVATVGQGMVLALVYYSGIPMNAILIVLPPLVFVLTVSAGVHLSNYYLEGIKHVGGREIPGPPSINDRVLAAQSAMRAGVAPCLVATFTTVVGLSSLWLVRLQPVQMFGVIASIGIIATLALLILILPGLMVMTRRAGRSRVDDEENMDAGSNRDSWPRWLRPRMVMVLFGVVAIFSAVGLGRLKTSVSVPEMFKPDSDLRTQYVWFEEHVGATMTGDLLLSFPRDQPVLDQLREVMRVHAAVQKLDAVGGVFSASTFLPIPSTSSSISAVARRRVIRSRLDDQDSDIHRLGYLDRTAGEDTWRITVRLYQTRAMDFARQIDLVKQTAQDATGSSKIDSSLTMTGHVVIVQRSQQLLLSDLFNSFLAAFVIIALMMTLYLRSFVGGMLSMIPNLVPTLILFGSMGWLRQPLDIGSVMTASVALGIAVDDSIHLLSRYRYFAAQGKGPSAAAIASVKQCGGAMLQTTVVCSLSLLVYGLSPFIPTQRFALFMLGLLTVALIGVATLLPAILSTKAGRFFSRSNAHSL